MGSPADPSGYASKLTYEDYVSLPDDGRRYEILDGELAVTPSPTTRHQRVSRNLLLILHREVTARGLGEVLNAPVDVILADTSITVPDIVFVAAEHAPRVVRRGIEGAPDLIVEILSPSTARRDRGVKKKLYARYGVEEYWLVDPEERTLEIYRRKRRSYRLWATREGAATMTSAVLSGTEIPLGEVWSD